MHRTAYGEPVSPYPGFSLLGAVQSFLGSSPLKFGLGIAMSAFSHSPWGWLAWGLNWLTQSVLFHQSDYYSQSTTVADWGLPRDGPHAYPGWEGFARQSYERTPGGSGRLGSGYNGNCGQGFGRPPDRNAENWRGNSNRGFQASGGGFYRTPRQAYNQVQTPESRQQSDRRSYVSSSNRGADATYRGGAAQAYRGAAGAAYRGGGGEAYRGGGGEAYRNGAGAAYRGGAGATYNRPMQSYRASNSGSGRGEFGERSSGASAGRNLADSAGKPSRSGGFHPFGGKHAPKTVSSRGSGGFDRERGFDRGGGFDRERGGHAPKSFQGGGKQFGGGHSHGGGGHSGGHGGGKHHH